MSRSFLLTILLFCSTGHSLFATAIHIINDTSYSFLISDHQLQAIMIPSQQSYDFDLEQIKPLYFYSSEKNNYFKLACTIKERSISQQEIKLLLSDILTQNFLAYPHLFFIPISQKESLQQTAPYQSQAAFPTTEQDTLSLLSSIKQQQQIARETYQDNNPIKPARRSQVSNDVPSPESMVQKISTIAASRSQNGHQFARSSRRN